LALLCLFGPVAQDFSFFFEWLAEEFPQTVAMFSVFIFDSFANASQLFTLYLPIMR